MNKEEQIIIDLMKKNKRLEKENKELIEEIEKQKNEKAFWHIKNDLKKDKIDKALELLDSYKLGKYDYALTPAGLLELEDILRGKDNED